MGACRTDELKKVRLQDIERHGSLFHVKIPQTKTSLPRSFTISDLLLLRLLTNTVSFTAIEESQDLHQITNSSNQVFLQDTASHIVLDLPVINEPPNQPYEEIPISHVFNMGKSDKAKVFKYWTFDKYCSISRCLLKISFKIQGFSKFIKAHFLCKPMFF